MDAEELQIQQDSEHLNWLVLFSRIVAVICFCLGCFPIIHVVIGVMMATGQMNQGDNPPPMAFQRLFGGFFIVIGGSIILGMWTLGVMNLLAAERLKNRYGHKFLVVVSAMNCLNMPFGTALGIFSLITLNRPTVRQTFREFSAPTNSPE